MKKNMAKSVLFFQGLVLCALCACRSSANFTPEELAKAREIAKITIPDICEKSRGTPAEYAAKQLYGLKYLRWSVREPDVVPQYYEEAVPRLAAFYDQIHKADQWKYKAPITAIPVLDKAPVIDGVLNREEGWRSARTFKGEYIIDSQTPDSNHLNTRWMIGADKDAFYIAFRCNDADIIPFNVTNGVFSGKKSHPVYEGDAFEFFIRPDLKKPFYLEVQVNADGLIWPLRNKLDPVASWQTVDTCIGNHGITAKTSRTGDGYLLEMRVPFTLLPELDRNNFSFMLLRTHRNNREKMWTSAVCPLLYNAHNVYGFIPARIKK